MAKNTLLIYGAGGLGKTTFLSHLAAWTFKKTGKKTRIITADGGGTRPYAPLIEEGVVECWSIDTWDEKSVFANYDLATKGWWPEDIGEPNSLLLPCKEEYRECPICSQDMKLSGPGVPTTCPICKKALPNAVRPRKKMRLINGFENVGAVCFEGLTAFGDNLKRRLRDIDPSGGRSIKDGDFTIAQLGQQHYGDAQTYMQQYVANSRSNIPVDTVVWTALELRGGDDGYGKPVYGPALPGKKLTSMCIPWFTDVLHLDGVPKMNGATPVLDANGLQVVERVCFLAKHFPADTKPFGFEAKSSAPLEGEMPSVIPFLPNRNNAEVFFVELAAAVERAKKKLLA